MIQTDDFGQFNIDIQKYNRYHSEAIILMANNLRKSLQDVSEGNRSFYNTEGYISSIIDGYRALFHVVTINWRY